MLTAQNRPLRIRRPKAPPPSRRGRTALTLAAGAAVLAGAVAAGIVQSRAEAPDVVEGAARPEDAPVRAMEEPEALEDRVIDGAPWPVSAPGGGVASEGLRTSHAVYESRRVRALRAFPVAGPEDGDGPAGPDEGSLTD